MQHRTLTIVERKHPNVPAGNPRTELDIVDEAPDKTRIRVREPHGKASIFLTDDQLDMLASGIAIRRGKQAAGRIEAIWLRNDPDGQSNRLRVLIKLRGDTRWRVLIEYLVPDLQQSISHISETHNTPREAELPIDPLSEPVLEGVASRNEIAIPRGKTSAVTLRERDFVECESCKAKPGSPQLCKACVTNRTTISTLQRSDANAFFAIQAMRACIVYARDRRGNAFDFDTWDKMATSALETGTVPPHAVEDAQSEALQYKKALDVERQRIKERDLVADALRAPAPALLPDAEGIHVVDAIERLRSDLNDIALDMKDAILLALNRR